ncbi:MAG: hypothetical protein KAT17_10355, partial [Candidatus Aminicenantes bacterium]|nr:hypothetical protein [Candidatus Aminicenantes bacterium]
KHFLYYTYEEAKKDIELKLINLAGEKSFDYPGSENSEKENVDPQFLSNLDIWNWKLKTTTEAELLKRASEDPSYKGLMNFLDISSRLHIIDSNYNVSDLIESMKLFNGPFIIGAVFIDFIQKIEPIKDNRNARRDEQLLIVSEHLRRFINKMSFPLILGVLYPTHVMVKYAKNESLLDDSGINLGGLEQDASLIIDLKQQKNKNEDIIVAKVLANRIGPKAEAHLKFNRLLLRIENQDE